MNKSYLCLYILIMSLRMFSSCVYAEYKQQFPNNTIILDVETAIHFALNYNNVLLNMANGVDNAQLSEKIGLSDFDFKIVPKGDSGYVSGGHKGTGLTLGGGVDFQKKMQTGALISVYPSCYKTGGKFHSKLQTHITQPLFRGFGKEYTLSSVKACEFRYRTAIRSLLKAANSIVMRTIELLYEIEKQAQVVKLTEGINERLYKYTKATQIKEKAGFSNGLDLFQSEIALNQSEDSFQQARDKLDDLKEQIREILALPIDVTITVNIDFPAKEDSWELNEAINVALNNRVELDQAIDQIQENQRLAKLAKMETLPELNLVLDYSNLGWSNEFYGSFGTRRENSFSVGFVTSTAVNKVRENCSYMMISKNIEAAERVNQEMRNIIILEVNRVLRTLKMNNRKIFLQRQQVRKAKGDYRLATIKFNRGFTDNFSVLQAENTLNTTETELVNSMIDEIIAEFRLKSVLGLLIKESTGDL